MGMRFKGHKIMGDPIKALVIGGMNIDILGVPSGDYRPGDSIPGAIRCTVGGVGFNIASRLAESGTAVTFVTVFGKDFFVHFAEAACLSLGLDTSLSLKADGPSPMYMAIHHQDGAMAAAVNDMASMSTLTPLHLQAQKDKLAGLFDVCVMDANLLHATIQAIPRLVSAPILADAVSVEKGRRLFPVLSRLTAIKPNAMEALSLSGGKDIPSAANWFLRQGVQQVYISLGKEGLYFASAEGSGHLSPGRVISAPSTGAGDAMSSGLAQGIAHGEPTENTAKMGLAAAEKYLMRKSVEV